ncbi:MAG TPA: T9SS type A sorting domain-containing protein [Chitinophagales bacterium]|nr:T9SS type A sorting domain-containing protein [Chitinophagales bacterium]
MKQTITLFLALMFAAAISKAQAPIPNGGFEDWTSMGTYDNPDSWTTLNEMTASASTFTCEKGTPGNVGAAYIKLTSKTVNGIGVVPGIAVCGTLDQLTMQPNAGFVYSDRPQNLTGKWQHMIFGNSQGFIDVQLTRWDAQQEMRIPVASAHKDLTGMAMSWAAFTIPLIYADGGYPDTCIIVLSASGTAPTNNDYLWVDALGFSGTVTGISNVSNNKIISIFPNPATNLLSIDLSSFSNSKVSVQISDVQGKIVKIEKAIDASATTTIDIATLPKGNYLLKVTSGTGTFTGQFTKE